MHSVKISSRGYRPEREAWMIFPGKNSIREVWKECIFHVEKWLCSDIDDLGPVGWAEEDHIKVCFLGLINQCKFDLKNSKWREKLTIDSGECALKELIKQNVSLDVGDSEYICHLCPSPFHRKWNRAQCSTGKPQGFSAALPTIFPSVNREALLSPKLQLLLTYAVWLGQSSLPSSQIIIVCEGIKSKQRKRQTWILKRNIASKSQGWE